MMKLSTLKGCSDYSLTNIININNVVVKLYTNNSMDKLVYIAMIFWKSKFGLHTTKQP